MKATIITKAEWLRYEVVSEPTAMRGKVKRDASGNCWEWLAGGKRVTAKRVTE